MPGRALAAVGLLTLGLFGTGMGLAELGVAPPSVPGWGALDGGPAGPALPYSRPVGITIPAIGVRARVEAVGRARNGAIDPPPLEQADTAGWYAQGPAPGEPGASVIVGHVDDRSGPAVFYRLGALRPGTRIEVTRRDRRVAVFRVDAIREYPKSALPTVEVFGERTRPVLRLITCGGRWVGGPLGYADNVVVFATLLGR